MPCLQSSGAYTLIMRDWPGRPGQFFDHLPWDMQFLILLGQTMRNWMLPEYIADILPAGARQLECAKAAMLENFRLAGYELVIPPLIEYIHSLVSEEDTLLDLKTFKVADHFSGRQMGLRADITPQVSRIDAHLLAERTGVTRLCYAGSVVHTRPEGLARSREPLQLGAELYGYAGLDADLEIIELMLGALERAGVSGLRVNIGHAAIYRGIAAAGLSVETSQSLFKKLQSKDVVGIRELVSEVEEPYRSACLALPELYGPIEKLAQARGCLPALPVVELGLMQLASVADALKSRVELSFDLTELRGTQYHNGLLFSAYAEGWAAELARGGRYDNIGQRFGRARPATGFSLDLREMIRILPEQDFERGIRVAAKHWPGARSEVKRLREAGEMVVIDYLGESAEALSCDRELIPNGPAWYVVELA